MALFDIDFPARDCKSRMLWHRGKLESFKSGKLTLEEGAFIWNVVVGWTDLCTAADRKLYCKAIGEWQAALNARRAAV